MIKFTRFIGVLLIMECLVFMAPFIVPSAWYYKLFLGEDRAANQVTFYQGRAPSQPDSITGWKKTPQYAQSEWVIDQWGSRSHRPIKLEKTPGVLRVLFLGNSLINGGNLISNQETISFAYEQAAARDGITLEVMNFATMAYNPGQSYLQLKERLLQFKPDLVIFGLPEAPYAGLGNLFLPFFLNEERNMPYVKPGFFNKNGQLDIILPPHEFADGHPQQLLDFLQKHDSHYSEFQRFQHIDLSPILWSLDYIAHRAENLYSYIHFDVKPFALVNMILAQVETLAQTQGFAVRYAYIPTPRAFGRHFLWQYLPDYYDQRLTAMQEAQELTMIDLRDILIRSKKALPDIYAADMYHFSPQGNQLIGQGIYEQTRTDLAKQANNTEPSTVAHQ